MFVTPEHINDIIMGKVSLPVVDVYSCYLEIKKVLIKARSDARFKTFSLLDSVLDLEDGMYYNDLFLFFKLGQDWIAFKNEKDEPHVNYMHGCGDVAKVAQKYFKTLIDSKGLIKGHITKTYLHYHDIPVNSSYLRRFIKQLSKDEFNYYISLFRNVKTLKILSESETFKQQAEFIEDHWPSTGVFNLDETYTYVLFLEPNSGFNIIVGRKYEDDKTITPMLEVTYSKDCAAINFEQQHQDITGEPLDENLKEIIANCFINPTLPFIIN